MHGIQAIPAEVLPYLNFVLLIFICWWIFRKASYPTRDEHNDLKERVAHLELRLHDLERNGRH